MMDRTSKLRVAIGSAAAVLALVFAPAAVAQSSSATTYGGQGGEAAFVGSGDPGDPGDPSGTATNSSSALPFSGLDVSLLAGGGLLLLLIGLVMARVTARQETS